MNSDSSTRYAGPRIIFATGNAGKMREIREILEDLELPVLSMKEAGITADIVEDGVTFAENALIKARAVHHICREEHEKRHEESFADIILADDSGLEVDYLNKAPGIYSARWLGEDTSYTVKNQEIIRRLEGVSGQDRSARFVCAVAAVFPGGETAQSRGVIEGWIAQEPSGSGGFGYDPVFWLPERGCTTADITEEEKNAISHRGQALRAIKPAIRAWLDERQLEEGGYL